MRTIMRKHSVRCNKNAALKLIEKLLKFHDIPPINVCKPSQAIEESCAKCKETGVVRDHENVYFEKKNALECFLSFLLHFINTVHVRTQKISS